jgi:hypothetical protein
MQQHHQVALIACLAACGAPAKPDTKPQSPVAWPVPDGWKTESFPFPLEFAPALAHKGVEELRFAPGMFEPGKPGYFSYAFVWRLEDAADLAPDAVAGELKAYFVGLEKAVDADKHRIANPDDTAVTAKLAGDHVEIAAHIFDPFATGQALDLAGVAVRHACETGSVWVFALAPATSGVQDQLHALVSTAMCGQPVVGKK